MTQETKILLGIVAGTAVLLLGAVFFLSKQPQGASVQSSAQVDQNVLIKDDSYKIGTSSAKVTMVEFADFQCPACGAAFPNVKRVVEENKDRMLYVYRHFPLPQHKNAQVAAEAAEAAGEQGKFWQMHDLLFENQIDWSESDKPLDIFVSYATQIGLDTDKFKQAVEGKKFGGKINRDKGDGVSAGVNATPTIFINNQKYTGDFSYAALKAKIDLELGK